MLSFRQFAEKFQPDQQSLSARDLAIALGVSAPISLRHMLEGKILYQLQLESLTCLKTETSNGPDHCRLDIYCDGDLEMPLRKHLDKDETWFVQGKFLFAEMIQIKLWDEDSPDADDLIQTQHIEAKFCQEGILTFSGDGAEYKLGYQVKARLHPQVFDLAQREIELFEQSALPGVWPYIVKEKLIQDLKDTIKDPFQVNQNKTYLCGPTAVVYELVARDAGYGRRPQRKRFVRLCRQLWETGKITLRSNENEPSDDLRSAPISPADNISEADWMLIATLRDVENFWEDLEGDDNLFESYTYPGAMKTWIFELLGFDEAKYETSFFGGEMETIKMAQAVWNQGGVAFLNIHSNLLLDQSDDKATLIKNPKPAGNFPDHWVAFQGGLELEDGAGMIHFSCYSWGRPYTVKVAQDVFVEYLFGAVIGER